MTAGAGPGPFRVHRLRVYVEPAGVSTFGIDHTGTLGDFTDVPLAEGSHQFAPMQDVQNPLHALQNVLDYQEEVLGKKSWTLNFTTPFAPTGVAAADTVTATAGAIQTMLKALMGGEFKGTGSTAAAAWSTAGAGTVASAAGFREGGIAGMADANGVVHFRPIKEVTGATGGTVKLKVRFPSAPASGAVIYSGSTYYWTQDPDTSLQFIIEGEEQQNRWVAMGGQGTVTPQLALDGTIQTLQWAITGCDWLEADEAAGSASLAGTALGNATYTNYDPVTGVSGRLLVQTNGTLAYTGASIDVNTLTFTPGHTWQAITSPSGVQGVRRWKMIRPSGTPMVSGTFATYFENFDHFDTRDNRTAKLVFYQNGVTAGECVAADAPTVQFTDAQLPDQNGIAGASATLKCRLDGDTTESTASDLGRSPWRYHFM